MVAKFIENQGKCPCLVLKLASEIADSSDPMREVLAGGQKEWDGILESLISEMKQKDKIFADVDAHKTARLIGHMVTGAMQRAIVARDASALLECVEFIGSQLLPKS